MRPDELKGKACKACSDFKNWFTGANILESKSQKCPLDRSQLGKSSWDLLHSIAAYYPEKPSQQNQEDISKFLELFSKFYPCTDCAEDFKLRMKTSPPKTDSPEALSKWLCDIHNQINTRLGKPQFNCSKVLERWRDGWKDGSCD